MPFILWTVLFHFIQLLEKYNLKKWHFFLLHLYVIQAGFILLFVQSRKGQGQKDFCDCSSGCVRRAWTGGPPRHIHENNMNE